MTVGTNTRKTIQAGNGINTNWNFAFAVRSAADLQVYLTDAQGVQTLLAANLYSVVLNPIPGGQLWAQGGTVTYPLTGTPVPAGASVTVARNVPFTQTSSLINQGGYSPQTTEQALDLLAMGMQQINETIGRALTIPISSTASTALPIPLANAMLGWDPTATFITNVAAAGAIPLPLPVASGGTGGITPAAARANLGLPMLGFSMTNGTLVPSQNGTQLTIAIKTLAGADPSAADPVYVVFRNATAKTGDYTVIMLTAATSLTTTVGGTFGLANNVAFRLWVVGFNDGGVFRLGLINCLTTVAGAGAGRDVTSIYPLAQFGIASSTLIGVGSTSAGVFYTAGAGVASKGYAVLGYLTYEAGLAAAGTFNVDQSRTDLFRPGMPLPGQAIQIVRADTGAVATGATAIPIDDTIPQSTEGDQFMSVAITPGSAANVLKVDSVGIFSNNTAAPWNGVMALFQDATANALKAATTDQSAAGLMMEISVSADLLAAGTVSTTFKTRFGSSAGTGTFNGSGAARRFGGVMNSRMEATEVMA